MARNEYKLVRAGVELGVVTHVEDDQPNHVGHFTAWSAFDGLRELFEEESRLLGTDPSLERWRQVRNEIDAPGLYLEPYEWVGKRIVEPLIHIRGEEAWWR
jgi:hypothetical protein